MSEVFTPLAIPAVAQPTQGKAFRLRVLPQSSSTATAFKPLQPAPAHPAAHAANPPTISLQRDGERVTHIRVACPCGEVFELACVY